MSGNPGLDVMASTLTLVEDEMTDDKPTKLSDSPPISFMERIRLAGSQHPSLWRFLGWFKTPSNLLSVIAVVAVVIVP